jgi:phosphoglycerate dehydrogenase-like enzyme
VPVSILKHSDNNAVPIFRVGITPDFYVDAKGRFEAAVESKLARAPALEYGPMPPQPGKLATPDALNRFDAIFALALKITRESLAGVERLALVARWGVGYDMIDVPALTEAGVALAITPNAVKRPVAEAILTFIFALSKDLREQDQNVRAGKWRGSLRRLGLGIQGKVLGSVGCGNIARELFRITQSLGFARRLAFDPCADPAAARSLGVELLPLEQVLRESDYVTINTLLNSETRGMIGREQLRLMKPTAFLINTARGPIVDQRALTEALQEKRIAGAGLDVFEKEPIDPADPLLSLDKVILSPHGLAWTEEIVRDNGLEACDHILSVARGELPEGLVNHEVANHPAFRRKLERYAGRKAHA